MSHDFVFIFIKYLLIFFQCLNLFNTNIWIGSPIVLTDESSKIIALFKTFMFIGLSFAQLAKRFIDLNSNDAIAIVIEKVAEVF
jgi:hypothetical protein